MARKQTWAFRLAIACILSCIVCASAQTGDALLTQLERHKARLDRRREQQAVHDFAGIFNAPARDQLEAVLENLEEQTQVAIVIVALRSMEGGQINEFATSLYERWGIGASGKDEGALVLFALKERKIWIETGYGLEGLLPDSKCGRILDDHVIPYFRADKYGEGLVSGGLALANIVARDRGVQLRGAPRARQRQQEKRGSPWLTFLLLAIMIPIVIRHPWLLFFILSSGRGGGYGGGGGGFGGGFGGFGGGLSGGGGAGRSW